MRRYSSIGIGIAWLLGAACPTTAQEREPEVGTYRLVSDLGHGHAFWLNPAALGLNERVSLLGHLSWDRPEGGDWGTEQYLLGIRSGVLGFGYRHDEFDVPGGRANGDAYTVAAGLATGGGALGISRTWRTVGETEGSWVIGWAYRSPDRKLSAGAVWRDIGSPQVRDTVRDARLIGAVRLRPTAGPLELALEADYRTGAGDFRRFRVGGATTVLQRVRILGLLDWDGDGDFQGFSLGGEIRFKRGLGVAAASLDSDGDARSASVGLTWDAERP